MTTQKARKCFLFAVLSAAFCRQTFALILPIPQGKDLPLLCYNASTRADFYVEVTFKDSLIAVYEPADNRRKYHPTSVGYRERLQFLTSGVAILKNVMLGDEGKYICTSISLIDGSQTHMTTDLIVLVPPKKMWVRTLVKEADAVTWIVSMASCIAEHAKPQATITWSSHNDVYFETTGLFTTGTADPAVLTVSGYLLLEFIPSSKYHNERFTCTIEHPTLEGGKVTLSHVVNVRFAPQTPEINAYSEGDEAFSWVLLCQANGNPEPEISWTLPNGMVYETNSVRVISPEDPYRHADIYICIARNGIAPYSVSNITTAQVYAKRHLLEVKHELVNLFFEEGEELTDPGITVTELFDGSRPNFLLGVGLIASSILIIICDVIHYYVSAYAMRDKGRPVQNTA